MDVRPIERSSVTEVTCPKQYSILAASKIHCTLSPLIQPEPHILSAYWGPTNSFCCSVNVDAVVIGDSTWRWRGHINTTCCNQTCLNFLQWGLKQPSFHLPCALAPFMVGTFRLGGNPARAGGQKGGRAKGHKVGRATGQEVERKRGREDARARGRKCTRARGRDDTRAREWEGTRVRGYKCKRGKGQEGTRVKGQDGKRVQV